LKTILKKNVFKVKLYVKYKTRSPQAEEEEKEEEITPKKGRKKL
jgi:hypothetical protein